MAFPTHGFLDFQKDRSIFIVRGTGPWNMESIFKSGEKAIEVKRELLGKPWAVLAIFKGEPIHTPDAEDTLVDILKEDIAQGRVGTAVILAESNEPAFGQRHITNIYEKAGEVFGFFEDEAQARVWLESQLEKANI